MKRMSYWAKYHPQAARILIALIEVTLIILSVTLGVLLLRSHILLHERVAEVSFVLIAVSVIFYPYRGNRSRQYFVRKLLEATLVLSVCTLGCFMANRDKMVTWNTYTPLMGHYVAIDTNANKSVPQKKVMTKKQTRKAFRDWLRKEARAENLNWLYIILIILGGIALLAVLVGLACSLGCAGNLTAAWLVGIIGGAGIIFLIVWGITKVSKSKSKRIEKRIARMKSKRIMTAWQNG